MTDRLYTLREVQARLRVSRVTLWKWRQSGHLRVTYVGPFRRLRVEAAALAALESQLASPRDVHSR